MLSFIQMLDKKTHFCSFSSAVPLIRYRFWTFLAWAFACLVVAVSFGLSPGFGEGLQQRLAFAGAPLLIGVVFGFLAFRIYLLIVTAQYQVITGECTSSPRGINPLPKIKSLSRQLAYSFMFADNGGINVYSVFCPYSDLPREGDMITLIATPNSMRKESQTETIVSSYIALKSVSYKAHLKQETKKKHKD